jgi:4-amino-4-deoxy-L-arabinose transferase-like glycosyltransferase
MLVLLALALWGGEFARRGLWEPDEARYAYVAREMRQGGHWFVPHINGEPYPDKPPLMFWLINVSSLLTGGQINGVSARLPSLLGSILSLWAMTRLLVRWHSTEAAWRAMLILPTSFLFWQEGGWGRIDALLCGLVMLSVYFFFTSLDGNRTRREVLAYIFAGLAVLAKGPVGLALPMGIFLVSALAGDYGRKLQRSHWLWGPLIALSIPATWLLVAWLQNAPPEYFTAMFGEKSFGRVVQSKGHDRPFYYFLLHVPMELLPWTVFLPVAVASMSQRGLRRMLLAWALFVIVLFSLFVCKRNVYILAAYPAAAMLIAAAWEDFPHLPRRWITAAGVTAVGLVCMLAAAATLTLFVPQIPFNRFLLIPTALVLLTGSTLLVHVFRRERLSHRWFVAFGGILLLLQISVSAVVLPGLNKLKGPVDAAEAVQEILPPDQPVYLYQQQLAIFPLYADRRGRELQSVEELRRLVSGQHRVVVVFNERQWAELASQFAGGTVAHEFAMGHKRLLWVEFVEKPPS